MRAMFNPGSPSSEHEETFEDIDFNGSNHKPRRRAGTEDSVGSTGTFSSSSSSSNRPCLADALKNSGEFHFDMSDRWRIALMESMDQPMFPEGDEPRPRRSRLRKGVTNFVKKRAQGLRRDSRRQMMHQEQAPDSPLSTS